MQKGTTGAGQKHSTGEAGHEHSPAPSTVVPTGSMKLPTHHSSQSTKCPSQRACVADQTANASGPTAQGRTRHEPDVPMECTTALSRIRQLRRHQLRRVQAHTSLQPWRQRNRMVPGLREKPVATTAAFSVATERKKFPVPILRL
jgi:hypothetical protein